ncbi:hypothetical protein TWF569_009745 [Orbilia oligospora]|uniref:Uncharacterized protein n=1 Tax=Orbilia oligospora TaxID=2813651 RepID=A0A7C8N986_ORBOL|nr:hypothetical protein TWF706_002033 [Orbilia oligospora]KAF3090355.1 hypothetical protein TWF102_009318 [Orbilia oligospora]KAF3102507.1 hypothetical protein TWF103_007674 [Orbilia oligospora]KAF3139530.1 hypothetical protein TWF703_003719 [Orbilia oligospora]KAF3141092.1 hypothetical protein TWF594_006131 [Orbilia oligospora]
MGSDPTPRNSFYSPPTHIPGFSTDFNPKAVQEAAQNPPPKKRPISGQYIESVPSGRYHVPAGMSMEKHLKRQANIQMAKRTIVALKASRWIMLAARFLQLIAAIGLVVLLITLRGMDTINGWIMRIPPGVAILHIVYSIYHNARDPKERPPLSSAGYALFAVGSDCCIIPFYVFIALWTWQQRTEMIANPNNPDNWVSVFNKDNAEFSQLMVFISFITACAGGGLMVMTVMLGLFIAITFRRISRLPPDMNPLDDTTYTSLTTRPSSKRFSKSSDLSSDSFSKSASRDVSPKRAVPFLEVRTKNGSLNWEFTKDSDSYTKSALDLSGAPNIMSDAPLLPPPHKFGDYGDTRRRSQDQSRRSQDQSRSAPNSPGHRKNKSMGYYSDHDNGPSNPPRQPRQTYKQRPAEWWTASNLQSNLGNAFPIFNGGQNSRYSAVSQGEDAHSTSTFGGDPHVSRNTFGRAPSHTTGQPDLPPQISSYAGSISTATAPSVVSSMPQSNPNRNSFGVNQTHMSTPPGVVPTLGSLGTLGTFATDLTPRPLSFPTNRSAPGSPTKNSPNHQHRNSVGRIPYARANTGGSPGNSPTKPVNGVLGSYARPPPQTSLTPPQMSPTKNGVSGTRMADNFGPNSYAKGGSPQSNGTGLMTPIHSTPSSPTKGTPPNGTASKKKKYETLSQNSPGRSTSWEKKQQQIQAQLARSQQGGYSSGEDRSRIKKMDKGRRKSLKELRDEREKEREREKEGKTRVVSNSGADFGHMFGNANGGGVRGRVISGSQVV